MKSLARSAAGRKAALTKKRRAAGRKAAMTKKNGVVGGKAALTKKRKLRKANVPGAEPCVTATVSAAIEEHLHAVIRTRAMELGLPAPKGLPVLVNLEKGGEGWFPVPGMLGGFAYEWDRSATDPTLVVNSWSRIAQVTQRHNITVAGVEAVDEDEPSFVLVEVGSDTPAIGLGPAVKAGGK
jgi:hypothetical protein